MPLGPMMAFPDSCIGLRDSNPALPSTLNCSSSLINIYVHASTPLLSHNKYSDQASKKTNNLISSLWRPDTSLL